MVREVREVRDEFEQQEEELYKMIGEKPVQLNEDMSHVVVLDGLPIVTSEKFDKLLQAMKRKYFTLLPELAPNASLFMPTDADGTILIYVKSIK
jgi:predicted sugar kinase